MNAPSLLPSLSAVAILTGCLARTPTCGDRVLNEGESKIAIAKQWKQGKGELTAARTRAAVISTGSRAKPE